MKSWPWSMAAFDVILYLVYTLASVSGLLLVKLYLPSLRVPIESGTFLRKDVLFVGVGAGLYILSFLVWLIILSRLELSVAYPIAIGLTLVFSTIAAFALLGERLDPIRVAGIGVVFIGVWLITRT